MSELRRWTELGGLLHALLAGVDAEGTCTQAAAACCSLFAFEEE